MTRIIKKYSNRKCYDTETSRYINLDEIEQLIKDEVDVRILDNETKEDITAIYLAKIIMNQGRKSTDFFSADYLKELIKKRSETLKDMFQKPLHAGSDFMSQKKTDLEKFLDKISDRGIISLDDAKNMVNDFLRSVTVNEQELDRKIQTRLTALIAGMDIPTREEVEALENKVSQLLEKIRKLD
jgi:polyhydroxyalkanoate synthesis repressor PhaR